MRHLNAPRLEECAQFVSDFWDLFQSVVERNCYSVSGEVVDRRSEATDCDDDVGTAQRLLEGGHKSIHVVADGRPVSAPDSALGEYPRHQGRVRVHDLPEQ